MGSGVQGLPGYADVFGLGDCFPNFIGASSYMHDEFSCGVNGNLTSVNPCQGQDPSCDAPTPLVSKDEYDDFHNNQDVISDIDLGYINQFLLEEDVDERVVGSQLESAVLAAEKPFLDILSSSTQSGSPDEITQNEISCVDHVDSGCENGIGSAFDDHWLSEYVCELHCMPELRSLCLHYGSPQSPLGYCNSSYNDNSLGVDEPCLNVENFLNAPTENEHMLECHFRRGAEEAKTFLPEANNLVIDLEAANFFPSVKAKGSSSKFLDRTLEDDSFISSDDRSRGRKNPYQEDLDLEEGRTAKQSAVMYEETIRSSLFDEVLLCNCGKKIDIVARLREALQSEIRKSAKNGQSRGSRGKSKGKKQVWKEVIDLRTLLVHCAQYVATDDRRSANELLRQIRLHSSPVGDGTQRLALIFANALEARLAGTGSERYHLFVVKRQSAIEMLKAYHLLIAACPFKRISHFFANQTILNIAENASKLHIIDFGIGVGFQWPCLIQRLSVRSNGPPELRITGVDAPQPGFRPNERLEETGRRLTDYCQRFGVPFEYQHIAKNWEDIDVEDLNLRKDELLVVNSMYRFRHLADEMVAVDSPRNVVLKNIRKMKPDIFIHGIVNGSFSAPFFVTRFREALFHYSSLFDMLDTTVPRDQPERLLIETEILGREAMNVIACEGYERVERPDTYKQWQVRNLKAGLRQLPLNREIMNKCKDRVRSTYHRDFLFDEDGRWLLQGWKGRIIFALSTWGPDDKYR